MEKDFWANVVDEIDIAETLTHLSISSKLLYKSSTVRITPDVPGPSRDYCNIMDAYAEVCGSTRVSAARSPS